MAQIVNPEAIHLKFFNQIYAPIKNALKQMVSAPLAIQPDTNSLLHLFEGLALHLNHFPEKNGMLYEFDAEFRNIANSIKHIRPPRHRSYDLEFAIQYEAKEGEFRFIRNTIMARPKDGGETLDFTKLIAEEMQNFCVAAKLDIPPIQLPESVYGFFEWAFAYHGADVSGLTKSTQISIVEKKDGGYVPFDLEGVRFVVFENENRGEDPRGLFPDDT